MKLENDVFLRALRRERTQYTPIWLMRQAGRFLPEYRAVRERCGSFMGLAKNPQAATEVTLQPVERFGLDAAILFSDILTIPDAMGLGLEFIAGEGPRFLHPVKDENAVRSLFVPDPTDKLRYVLDATSSIRKALNGKVPLIGFSGSPFTLACYMVEGGASKDFSAVKHMLYARPDLFNRILDINIQAIGVYLAAQISAGAQALQIFDTWGGMLSGEAFKRFSLEPIRRTIQEVRRHEEAHDVPIIVFTKGGSNWIEEIATSGADAIGLDWTIGLSSARKRVKDSVCLQGNLDPAVLLAGERAIETEVCRILEDFGEVTKGAGHVFNLGHGVLQQTPPGAVKLLVETVHAKSKKFHQAENVV